MLTACGSFMVVYLSLLWDLQLPRNAAHLFKMADSVETALEIPVYH